MAGTYFLAVVRLMALVSLWLICSPSASSYPDPERVSEKMLLLVEADNGRTVDAKVGETVRVILPENATTGYRWAVDRYDEQSVAVIGTEPQYMPKAVGSGGEVAFTFQAKKVGTSEIVLKYWRHWEGDSSVTKRFGFRLDVQP